MDQQQAEIERMADFCQNLLRVEPHQISLPQEAIARCVWRRAKEALESLKNPEMDYPTAFAEFADARLALLSTRESETNNRHAIHDFKIMQMYRYVKTYVSPRNDELNDPLAYHPSRFINGYPGPASISHTGLQPGNPKNIGDLLHHPEQYIRKGTFWWFKLYMGVQQDRATMDDWSKNLCGKGKSKQPDTPYICQLREILDLLEERNDFMALETIRVFLHRHSSLELILFRLLRENQYGMVARSIYEDLTLFDRRLPEGYDGSLLKKKVRQAIDKMYVIKEDEETGELASWVLRGV